MTNTGETNNDRLRGDSGEKNNNILRRDKQ